MSCSRIVRVLTLVAALAICSGVLPAVAAGPQASGSGVIRSSGPGAAFMVELDETQMLIFAYFDYADDRVLSISGSAAVDCLGDLFFNGQTMRLTGVGSDSALPGESVTLQLFLVDGGDSGFDQLSLKASRSDGTAVYFAGLNTDPFENGGLTISCPV
jgi:hypothetical protein